MCLEAVSEIDAVEKVAWNEKETITRWNGRDLNALHRKHPEGRISSVALQRARFNNDQTGYVLCRVERYSSEHSMTKSSYSVREYNSTSQSKHSNDKTSESDSEESEDRESKIDMTQSISAQGKYDRDNHGHSSNKARLKYENSIRFKNGHSLDIGASVSYERHVDRAELSDRTSGEIDASYNF